MKRRIVCFCEHSFDADIPLSIDLGKEPEVEQAIISGEFLNIRCPNCGKVLKPEFPVFIDDPQAENSIFFVPELDRGMYFRGALSYSLREANRVAIGYEELVEKFLIKRHNLDDRVVEIVKYFLLSKIMEDYSGDKIRGNTVENDDGTMSVEFKTRDGKWKSKGIFDGQLLIGTFFYEFQDRRVQRLRKGEWAAQRVSDDT